MPNFCVTNAICIYRSGISACWVPGLATPVDMFAELSAVCCRVCSVLILFKDGETSIILSAKVAWASSDMSGPVDARIILIDGRSR